MTNIKYRRGRHSVTLIYTHFVFVTKYRKKIFTSVYIDAMAEICKEVARKMDLHVLEINGEAAESRRNYTAGVPPADGELFKTDQVHLLIEYPPKLSVSQIANVLKGVSSRMLRKEFQLNPHVDHLWSPSYFAISCGGAPIEEIKKYIENQEKPP